MEASETISIIETLHREARERGLFFQHAEDSLLERRTVTVKDVVVDRPVEDCLFRDPLTEGATVIDDTHDPPLHYKHKARFTAHEWNAIVLGSQIVRAVNLLAAATIGRGRAHHHELRQVFVERA